MLKPTLKKVDKWKADKNAEKLVRAVESDQFEIQAAAIKALSELQHQPAVELITQNLTHPLSPTIRIEAAKALEKLRPASAVKNLVRALRDEEEVVREAAKRALINIGEPAIEDVIAQFGDFYYDKVRDASREILIEMGRKASPSLISALQKGTGGIRIECAKILGEIADSTASTALKEALLDDNINVRRQTAQSLDKMGWKPSKDAYGVNYYLAKNNVESALAIGAIAKDFLPQWLRHEDHTIRRKIAIGLQKLGWKPKYRDEAALFWAAAGKFSQLPKLGEDAYDVLIWLLGDKNNQVKKAAAKTLKVMGVPPNVKQLVKDIESMTEYMLFKLQNGTFNVESLGFPAEHFKGKYYLLRVDNCDAEMKNHVLTLYPEAEIIDEKQAQ